MQPQDKFNLGYGFQRYFSIEPALSVAQQEQVFRIRHQVYCEELGFEPLRADGLEQDAFDAQSLHCLLRAKQPLGEPVGCARLVLTDPDDPQAPLPFELSCAAVLDRALVDPAKLRRERIAEVSRLAVRGAYRRRRGEQRDPVAMQKSDFGSAVQPRFPYISIGLYLGAISLAARSGITNLFILTEPRLAAHFSKLGVHLQQIGAPIEHRGMRIPSMLNVQDVIVHMRGRMRPIWRVIDDEIAADLTQATADARAPLRRADSGGDG